MPKNLFVILAMALIPASLFAVDGQVLINQSVVNAAGGFPYKITQPGSYKLSGDLTMNTSAHGNFPGMDVAILIASNNVTIDLNGFTITVTDLLGLNLGHPFYAIAESDAFSQITVVNGAVRMTTNTNRIVLVAINVPSSVVMRFEGLNLVGKAPVLDIAPPLPQLLIAGADSVVHHVVTNGGIQLKCPSIATDNVAFVEPSASGCVIVNPVGSLIVGVP